MKRYRKNPTSTVTAVQLNLETDGFQYQKWGDTQTCKRGDWLVNNDGDVYTVDAESFSKTYSEVSPGVYLKSGEVYAEIAEKPGIIRTQEGSTRYKAGDYLVFNYQNRKDGYAVSKEKFESMYTVVDE